MRIVSREEFLQLPKGTVYAEYEPCIFGNLSIKIFGNLSIKDDTVFSISNQPIDFYCLKIANSIESSGSEEFFERVEAMENNRKSFPVDLDSVGRDGLFETNQLYVVWEKEDVQSLITVLQKSLLNFN